MERFKNNLIGTFLKNNKKLLQFHLLINIAFLCFITLASYVNIPLSDLRSYSVYFLHLLILQVTVSGFLYLISLNKWIFKIVFNALFVVLGLVSFWVYTQDISITDSLFSVVLESKPSIIIDVLSIPYFIFIAIYALVLIYINNRYDKLNKRFNIFFFSASLLAVALFYVVEQKRFNTLKSRLPYNVFYGLVNYLEKDNYVLNTVSKEVYSENRNLKIIFILGESVREDHLSINGYIRETTPLLDKQENVISYKNISTPHTYTNSSVPRILSNISTTDKQFSKLTSLYSVFNSCGYKTSWIGNQELERSYKSIVNTNNKVILIDSLRSVLSFNKAYDDKLLDPFKEQIGTSGPQILTIHMMGSHWYYDNRYPERFRKFKPVTDSKYIPSQTDEQIINAYDNTIIYLDYFLNEIIDSITASKEPTIFIYLSDHGERLGEHNKWLHAETAEESTNPACIIWYSKAFENQFPTETKALKANKNRTFSTDFLFTSLLDLINVKNIEHEFSESIFNEE